MPCDYDFLKIKEAQKRREAEEKRQEELRQVEEALNTGIATIQQNSDGTWTIMGVDLPTGMHDSCVLAHFQAANSMALHNALMAAGVSEMDFVGMHNRSHGS